MVAVNIPGFDNYFITRDGRVFTRQGREKKPSLNYKGYLVVNLRQDGKQHMRKVHRLVAMVYLPNPLNKPQVNHIDGNKWNNKVENLEWLTNKENHLHASRAGLLYTTRVDMLTKDGEYLRTFDSLKSAEAFVGAKRPNGTGICSVLRGATKTAYGYRWRRAE